MAPILLLPLASSFTHHHIIWILYRAETEFSYKLSLAHFGICRVLGNYAEHTASLMQLILKTEFHADGFSRGAVF